MYALFRVQGLFLLKVCLALYDFISVWYHISLWAQVTITKKGTVSLCCYTIPFCMVWSVATLSYFKRTNTSICFWAIKKLFLECPFCWRSFVPSERGDVCYTWRAVANFTISSSISWVIKFVFIWSPFDRLGCLFEPRFITQLWPLEVIWSLHRV